MYYKHTSKRVGQIQEFLDKIHNRAYAKSEISHTVKFTYTGLICYHNIQVLLT